MGETTTIPDAETPKEEQRAEKVFAIDDVMRAHITTITALPLAGVDITEIYSPRRVVEMAEQMGLRGGFSLDFTTGWNFDNSEDRHNVWEYIIEARPFVVIGSPMHTMFSQLQN